MPGDFGTPGASILPVGYRQVAAVYIPHGKHSNAYKIFRFSDYGLQQFDSAGIKIKSGVYRTTPLHTGGGSYVALFYIQTGSNKTYINYYPMGTPKKYQLRNGGSSPDVNIPGGDLLGIHDLILNGSDVIDNGQTLTTTLPVTAYNVGSISPFVGTIVGSSVHTCNIATRYLKMYNQDDLVLFFIPVVRSSDGVPGLFELVNEVFIANTYATAIEKIEL